MIVTMRILNNVTEWAKLYSGSKKYYIMLYICYIL